MLTVYTRYSSKCPNKDEPSCRRCRCWKWILGTIPGRPGSMRIATKTRSWEQAESLARKYEIAAVGGDEVREARSLPTLKEAVHGYLSDAAARGLAPATIQKLEHIFKKQLLAFAEQHRIVFLREVNVHNMTEWRSTSAERIRATVAWKQAKTHPGCKAAVLRYSASGLSQDASEELMSQSQLQRVSERHLMLAQSPPHGALRLRPLHG